MKITFLGSGSAWVTAEENYHSNIIIESNGKKLLYDCGTTIQESLKNLNIKPQDIDSIFISHLHSDHSGGIEFMAFYNYFNQYPFGVRKPTLISTKELLDNGWEHSWSAGLKSLSDKDAELSEYFKVKKVNKSFTFENLKIEIVPTEHSGIMKSYGIFIKDKQTNKKVYITSDTSTTITKDKEKYYKNANIIFHDCEFADYDNSVHTQFRFLKELPNEIKGKMWLYHYSLKGTHIWKYDNLVEENGFLGVVRRGQRF